MDLNQIITATLAIIAVLLSIITVHRSNRKYDKLQEVAK